MENEKIEIQLRTVEDAKRFVSAVTHFRSDVDLLAGRRVVDAKSILGVFSLSFLQNMYVRIISEDPEECEKFKKAMEEFKEDEV